MALIRVDSDNSLVVENCYEERRVVSDIGGRWDSVRKVWRVVFTTSNLEYLMENLTDVTLSPDIEAKLLEQRAREEKLAKLRAMSKQDVPVTLRVPGLKASLYNYQRLGVMYAVTNGYGILLADEMGLGKTLQAIGTAMFLKSKGLAKNALIITPASLKFNWPIEIEKFTDEKYVVIDGQADDRVVQWLRTDVFFYIVNYELLLEDLFGGRSFREKEDEPAHIRAKKEKLKAKAEMRQRLLAPIRNRIWDFIAVDECQAMEHHSSKRTRNVKDLKGQFRMALTGTPLDGRLEELHSIMEFVAPGLLSSKTRFFQRHVETDFWGRVTGYKRVDEVSSRIQPFFLRRLKKDVLTDLPDKIYENRIVSLTPREREIYLELANGGHEATEDAQAMVAIIRCKQFCNYPAKVDARCTESSKLDAFRDVLDEVVIQNGHKALIFSQYKEMVDVLVKVLEDMGIKYLRIDGDTPKSTRAEYQAQFDKDKTIDVMIGTEAMSTGLNFAAADYVINYDDNWSPSIMAQREDRAHRIGQRNVVTVVNFICKDTIEDRIRAVLFHKSKITSQVLGDNTDEAILMRLNPREIAKLL